MVKVGAMAVTMCHGCVRMSVLMPGSRRARMRMIMMVIVVAMPMRMLECFVTMFVFV